MALRAQEYSLRFCPGNTPLNWLNLKGQEHSAAVEDLITGENLPKGIN
jgi:hypothetical protein